MTRITTALAAALVATAMLSVPLSAQTNPPPPPPATTQTPPATTPSTVDKIKNMTKSEWSKLRAEWRKNKDKYAGCRDKAKADNLKGTKRWASIYDCMMAP